MDKITVYLDDCRPKPSKFDLLCRTAEEVIELIKQDKVSFVSLDNDLGEGYSEGKTVAQFIEKSYLSGEIKFVDFHPHTSNPVAWDEIMACKRNVYKKFKENLEKENECYD